MDRVNSQMSLNLYDYDNWQQSETQAMLMRLSPSVIKLIKSVEKIQQGCSLVASRMLQRRTACWLL